MLRLPRTKYPEQYAYYKTAYPMVGSLIVKYKVTSRFGTTTHITSSEAIDVRKNVRFMIESCRIQARFGHIQNFGSWSLFYQDSDQLAEDDEIELKVLNYNFAYPKSDDTFRYKVINVKGKRKMQVFRRNNGRYVYDQRYDFTTRKPDVEKIHDEIDMMEG